MAIISPGTLLPKKKPKIYKIFLKPQLLSMKVLKKAFWSTIVTLIVLPLLLTDVRASEPKIVIIGSVDASIEFWKNANFWGKEDRAKDLLVPRAVTAVITKSWKQEADQIPVEVKKELFYRALIPLILYANELILRDRKKLEAFIKYQKKGKTFNERERLWLHKLAIEYKLVNSDSNSTLDPAEIPSLMDKLLVRVDIIPPSLALGQGAYESGYGTSRFTLLGNALFGQWTYGGKGIKPKQQRKEKGDYRIAAYDWPFDSVRTYMRNLNTHRTYSELRHKRAELRKRGKTLTGLALANTLTKYSEKGKTYVDTLKGIIRTNGLDIADNARLRDEPLVFIVNVETEDQVKEIRDEIEKMRISGELTETIREMRLGVD